MRPENSEIDIGKWEAKLDHETESLHQLWGFSYDSSLFSDHFDRIKVFHQIEDKWVEYNEEKWAKEKREEAARSGFEHVCASYYQHVIIVCCSYVDQILWEFSAELFKNNPAAMHPYVKYSEHSSASVVSLRTVLEAENLDNLMEDIRTQASRKFIEGKIESVAKRVKELAGMDIPDNVKALVSLRNRLVHEDQGCEVSNKEAHDAVYAIKSFLRQIQQSIWKLDAQK